MLMLDIWVAMGLLIPSAPTMNRVVLSTLSDALRAVESSALSVSVQVSEPNHLFLF